jgi:cell division septal protein FtsQ
MRFLLFAIACTAIGQPVFPLETVHVEGNRRIAAEKIVAASGLKIGTPVTKEDFDRSFRKRRLRVQARGG